jgi:hypothetical protein
MTVDARGPRPFSRSRLPIVVADLRVAGSPATCGPLPRIEELIDLLEHRSHE